MICQTIGDFHDIGINPIFDIFEQFPLRLVDGESSNAGLLLLLLLFPNLHLLV